MDQKILGRGTAVSPAMSRAMTRWRRVFYGMAVPKGGHPSGLAAAVTSYLSVLVTAELSVQIRGGKRAEFLNGALSPVLPQLQQAVQTAAVEGQCILRPLVQDGELLVETIPASRFYPIRFDAAGNPVSGYFTDFRTAGNEEFVRLESFDFSRGELVLRNQAYRCRGEILEKEVPLDAVEDWKNLQREAAVERAPGPLFGVIRMPFVNTADPNSRLPVSLFAGAEQSLLEFDRLYGEMLYEMHSGKRKRILERQALPNLSGKSFPGAPGYRDLSTDTYLVLDPMEQQKPFDDYSPVMRTEAYLASLRSLLHLLETQCHLSPGALALEPDTAQPITAAEVVSRDRTTYHTCSAVQEQGLRPALEQLIRAMNALADLYHLAPAGTYTADISFGDGVFEDTQQEFSRQLQMVEKGILKPELLLSWYFHVDPEEARRDFLKEGTA